MTPSAHVCLPSDDRSTLCWALGAEAEGDAMMGLMPPVTRRLEMDGNGWQYGDRDCGLRSDFLSLLPTLLHACCNSFEDMLRNITGLLR